MTNEERDNLLLKMDESITRIEKENKQRDNLLLKMDESINEILKEQNELKERMTRIEGKVDKMQKHVLEIEEVVIYMQGLDEERDEKILEMQKEIRNISNKVTFIEYEHGRKIQLLLEHAVGINYNLGIFEKRFESNDSILDRYDARIYNLESKVSNL